MNWNHINKFSKYYFVCYLLCLFASLVLFSESHINYYLFDFSFTALVAVCVYAISKYKLDAKRISSDLPVPKQSPIRRILASVAVALFIALITPFMYVSFLCSESAAGDGCGDIMLILFPFYVIVVPIFFAVVLMYFFRSH